MNVDKTKIEVKTEIEINSIEFFSLNSDILMGYIQKIFLPSTKQHVQDSRHDPTSSSLMKAFYRHQIKANFWKHCLFSKKLPFGTKSLFGVSRRISGMISTNFYRFFQISIFSLKFGDDPLFSETVHSTHTESVQTFLIHSSQCFSLIFFTIFFVIWHCAIIVLVFCSKQTLPGQCLNQQSVSTNFGCLKIYH